MKLSVQEFDSAGGANVALIVMQSKGGQEVQITNYGGIIHKWLVPDRKGVAEDVLLGCRDMAGYRLRHPYFGAIVGRYANRIAYGKFTLNGVEYQLNKNLPPHHLHGGNEGLDRKVWQYDARKENDLGILTLNTESPHMEEGFPGSLRIKVQYTFDEAGNLHIEYEARTDRATHINLTNHCYFNLSGVIGSTILDHEVRILSDSVTESDTDLIPTGKISPVAGTALDVSHARIIGECLKSGADCFNVAHGFDHNYVLPEHKFETPVASAYHPGSGRRLQVYTDQPAIQFYTGNWLNGVQGKYGSYHDYAGFCLETQHFPDSPNQPGFPSTLLRPGDVFKSKTIYRMDVSETM